MLDDIRDIAFYYNNDPDRELNRLDRHQLEHDLTWCYLERYLPAQGRILEVGAATGRYTVGLARRGYQVTALDLSAELLKKCRENLEAAGVSKQVQLVEADARDLSPVLEKQFDAVLLMGPFYHLVEEPDRVLALQEGLNRLRPGGMLFSAWISRFGILGNVLRDTPEWIEDQTEVQALLEIGKRPDDYPRGGFRSYFTQIAEIVPFHEGLGLQTCVLAGVEPAISADDGSYNRLEGRQRQLWLDLLYKVSAEPSILGASRHLLYIGKKR
jgi:SAM-dependent methyltransferase